jgi:hypothetical protein
MRSHASELILRVQALIAELPVEALDEGTLDGPENPANTMLHQIKKKIPMASPTRRARNMDKAG